MIFKHVFPVQRTLLNLIKLSLCRFNKNVNLCNGELNIITVRSVHIYIYIYHILFMELLFSLNVLIQST